MRGGGIGRRTRSSGDIVDGEVKSEDERPIDPKTQKELEHLKQLDSGVGKPHLLFTDAKTHWTLEPSTMLWCLCGEQS